MAEKDTTKHDIESLCNIVGSWPKREPSHEELLATYKAHYSYRGRKVLYLALEAMCKKYGESVYKVVEDLYYQLGAEDGEALKAKHGDLLRTTADMSTRPYCYEIEHSHTTEDRIEYKVVKCPSADLMKEMGLEKIGIAMCPGYHVAYAKAFGYRFSMPKFLLKGDDCCEQIWEREEDAGTENNQNSA